MGWECDGVGVRQIANVPDVRVYGWSGEMTVGGVRSAWIKEGVAYLVL